MAEVVTDFISLIKDIRGNQFDAQGLPLNGKWKDIKDWHTSVGLTADQVVVDASQANSARAGAEAALASAQGIETAAATSAAQAAASATDSSNSATESAASAEQAFQYMTSAEATKNSMVLDLAAITAAKTDAETSATLSGNYSAQAQASATAAGLSEQAASVSEANALQSANNADISEGNALTYRDATETLSIAAETNATAAANSASSANASELAAAASKDAANKWASEAEDVPVDDGINPIGFSAYHWAQKAVNIVGGVTSFTDLADAPSAYTGAAGYTLKVNAAGNAIEFVLGSAADVGLGNVDNTSDADKPLSTAATSALALKAPITVTDSLDIRLSTVEANTVGITNQIAAGNDPDRVQISKTVYSTASQTLGAVEPPALTRYDLVASMLAAETIGTY